MRIISDFSKFLAKLNLDQKNQLSNDIQLVMHDFSLRVTEEFIQKMQSNLNDPLLLQVLPQAEELKNHIGYNPDPLDEKDANPTPCLLHKYYGRVLLLVTKKCAMHCRFCFRRHFLNKQNDFTENDWQSACNYIQQDKSLSEVILSGGEPLLLFDKKIKNLLQSLAAISHLKRLRIHTRLPIAAPSRITENLIAALTATRLAPIVVVHCNHAAEIDAKVIAAVQKLRAARINILNQSVLLKGINDSITTLTELSIALGDIGVIPYYLHLLDKVAGAAHFAVTFEKAKKLHLEMQHLLSGYLVPKLVCEKARQITKILL